MESSSIFKKAERNQGGLLAAEHALERKGLISEHLPQPPKGATQTEPVLAAVVI